MIAKKRAPFIGAIVVYHPPEGFELEDCGPKPHVLKPGGAACDTPVPRKSNADESLVKRVVAGPGDEIYVRAGHVYRRAHGAGKFVRERDPYIRACGASPECNYPDPIKIPPGHWFLMGDNRGASVDSRMFGPLPAVWMIGTVDEVECERIRGHRFVWVRRSWRVGCRGVRQGV